MNILRGQWADQANRRRLIAILAGELHSGQTAVLSVVDGAVKVTAEGEIKLLAQPEPARAA